MHDRDKSRGVARWRAFLFLAAWSNLVLWALSALRVTQGSALHVPADIDCRLQLLLCAGYVFSCAFRSVLPVYDVPRIVLVDSWLSSVVVGRSVATLGELCFAAQWALILHHLAHLSGSPFGQAASLTIVPLIVIAECFSWYAVLSTSQRGHIVENSLWGASAALLMAGLFLIGTDRLISLYPPMLLWCVGGVAYVIFMFVFDVPMYWSRWRSDQVAGRQYLSLAQGLADVSRRWLVSYRWEDWKTEVLWMTLYFTGGVWSSISVVYACLALTGHVTDGYPGVYWPR
ncbi:MAG TPA: hypothetical protein VMT29_16530 [Steroidobacteraceae bacterium]|nr:hypothetical protein [Steroidobacteraceae bacterium]